jgi:hypothetical protein
MRACKHFEHFGMETHVIPSENRWNAWVEVYDERGNLYYSTFETGGYLRFLEHLQGNVECGKEVARCMGMDLSELGVWVAEQIAEINLEWIDKQLSFL